MNTGFRANSQVMYSWIYINTINITLHFFTHVETLGVGYINNYFFNLLYKKYMTPKGCPPKAEDVPRRLPYAPD